MSPAAPANPQIQRYLESASPIGPPPKPIKVGDAFLNYDYLTGLANASDVLFPVPSYSDLTVRNRQLVNVSSRITRITVSLSTQLQSQLTIEIEDPSFALLQTGIFQGQPDVNYKGLRLELAGVATLNRGRGALSLKARSHLVQSLKRRRGPLTVIGDERSFIGYECAQVGLPFVTVPVTDTGEGPALAKVVSRDWQPYAQANVTDFEEIPSSWTTFKRLADQRGWMLFEANNVMYFAPMSWLLTNATMVKVRFAPDKVAQRAKWKQTAKDTRTNAVVVDPSTGGQYWRTLVASGDYDPGVIDCLDVPVFDHSSDRIETTVSFNVEVKDARHFLPGKVVDMHGVPNFEGLYICTGVIYDLTGPTAQISAQTPVDPQPSGGSTFGGFAGGRAATAVTGVDLSGSGSDAMHLPVCGITLPAFLRGMRQKESGSDYKSPPKGPDYPSGAYQYTGTRWRGLVGAAAAQRYPQAYLAPPDLQDQAASTDVRAALNTYDDDWGKVAADHIYPCTAGRPHLWFYRPYMEPHPCVAPPAGYDPTSNPRVIDYVRDVLKLAGGVMCPQFTAFGTSTKLATDFVNIAVSQVGKPYEQTTAVDYEHTANPKVFDCSALVQWSCAGVGVFDMPRNSGDQWDHCKKLAIKVSDALNVRGALLWVDGGGREGGEHVAISMGDGKRDMAAHTSHAPLAQQISVAQTDPSYWNRAALIPGMDYTGSGWNP